MSRLETSKKSSELSECLQIIEEKLGWGDSDNWSSYDFEKLSDAIFQETGTKLSANTLKRIWGRLPYESRPSTSTLNALAGYLGFADWREFISRKLNSREPSYRTKSKTKHIFAISALFLLAFLYFSISGSSFFDKNPNPEKFSFSSRRITNGLPNSVIFDYSAPGLNESDKLEIQQSWDDSKRHTISNVDSVATSVYYKPGFFNAKLVVNGATVKEHGLLIPSGGWFGLLETKGLPLYFDKRVIMKNEEISISKEMIAEKLKEEDTSYERASLYYIEDFDGLYLNDFTIDMVVSSDRKNSNAICQASSITVYCEGEVLIVPLTSKGCISEINLMILDRLVYGKTNDLSKFGVDSTDEIAVKVNSSDSILTIFINDEMAYSDKIDPKKRRSISGIRYSFPSSGNIKEISIKNKKRVLYTESFPRTEKVN